MTWFTTSLWSLCLLSFVSGDTLFQRLLLQGAPCIEVTKPSNCNTDLAKSFKPQNSVAGRNEPTTLALLFSPSSPVKAEPLHLCGGRLPSPSTFDSQANTEIFIHGWLDGVCRTAWMREMKEQLFQWQKCDPATKYNVILIDWTWGNTDHTVGAANCKVVGEQVGFIINNIMEQTGSTADKFHVIGHSFGAIAAGFAGRSVPEMKRISGLDPASTPFKNVPPNQRVTFRDAKIVDIIHTNAGDCWALAVGDPRCLGHADFFPNGGSVQMSCYPYIIESLLKGDFLYALASLDPRLCSHLQAIQYYKVSINRKECGFSNKTSQVGTATCPNHGVAVMGMDFEKCPPAGMKAYYLDTTLCCPYYDNSNVTELSRNAKRPEE